MRALGALAVSLLFAACAHTHVALDTPLGPQAMAQARAALEGRAAPPPLWAANGLLVAYAHQQRLRTRVQWLVAAPHQFRLTVLGPHNAALAVIASDGRTLTSVDMRDGQRVCVPASREGLRQLTQGFDVGLELPMWLSLLSFALPVPPDATAYERPHHNVAWSWSVGQDALPVTMLADAQGRIVAAHVPQADGGVVHASFLPPSDGHAPPIAKEIDVRSTRPDGQTDTTLSLSLEQVELSPPLVAGSSPFVVGTAP